MRLLKQMIRTCVALAALLTITSAAFAQGVTSAALTGVVKDDQGGVVPGATVVAVHQPSGSAYTAVSQGDGRYTIAGMRVGGPYTVTAELAGFVTAVQASRPLKQTNLSPNKFLGRWQASSRDSRKPHSTRPSLRQLEAARRNLSKPSEIRQLSCRNCPCAQKASTLQPALLTGRARSSAG